MALHDRGDAFEVLVEFLGRRGPVDRGAEAGEQVGDRRPVLLERAGLRRLPISGQGLQSPLTATQ
ncbi:hypothetical protein, partial [Streptomyces sp. NPDC006324]|uniref:hypothetical protein n=1 Tax=Streptomyces sp. NPDC006324 TaxID=3156751 RepID=UPI0033AB2C02